MAAVTNRQRKEETRGRLLDAASNLFAELGYENATLDAIAAQAGLHVQTLYRHFPCKAELAAELWHRSLNDFELYFASRSCSSITAWREWVVLSVLESSNTINALAGRNSPPVSGRVFEYWDRYQQILADGLAEDMGTASPGDIKPMLIACMLWGGNQRVAMTWVGKRWDEKRVIASLVEVVDTVEALFPDDLSGQSS